MSVVVFEPLPPTRYLALAVAALRRESVYRINVLVAVVGLVLRVYVLYLVWTELYRANAAVAPAGITLNSMLTYTIVGQLLLLGLQVDSAPLIREKVREGFIATDLIRPVRFPLYLLADNAGAAILRLCVALPAALFAGVLLRPTLPSWPHAIAFGASVVLGFAVVFLLDLLANLTAFWTLETFGLQYMLRFAGFVLSGVFVPLWFFPDALRPVLFALPFASIQSTPLSIFVGRLDGVDVITALGVQIAWVALLSLVVARTWRAAERRITVQGG